MLKSYWWVGGWVVVVAYRILVSALVPFGFRSYWDLVGVGHRGFGNKQGCCTILFFRSILMKRNFDTDTAEVWAKYTSLRKFWKF